MTITLRVGEFVNEDRKTLRGLVREHVARFRATYHRAPDAIELRGVDETTKITKDARDVARDELAKSIGGQA